MSTAYDSLRNTSDVPPGVTAESAPEEVTRIREALTRLETVLGKLHRQRDEYLRDLQAIEQLLGPARWRVTQ